MPAIGPLLYGGHGSMNIRKPTKLQTDFGDAANLMVYASELTQFEEQEVRERAGYE